jgi:putative pre-16S rRNA nuclease
VRLLGVDFGGKRIGLAVMDSNSPHPRPLAPLEATGSLSKDALAIKGLADREGAGTVVLGLPLDTEGETKMSKVCRQLATRIEETGLKVALVDESMTSQEAESAMRAAGLKASQARRRVDGEAACRILERYREEHGS